ncbi:hypothetical protein AURDEDRAFT_111488, partial [Auricularia subglabra TFB-10046 SS5]
MATLRALPIELVGHVAAFSEPAPLVSLALVSQAFKLEAARALYGSVSIRNTDALLDFARTIRDHPRLAALVRSLCIEIYGDIMDGLDRLKLDCCRNLRHLFISTLFCYHRVYSCIPDNQLLTFELTTCWSAPHDVDNFLRQQRRLTRVSFDDYSKLASGDLPCLRSLEAPLSSVIHLARDRALEDVTVLGTVEGPTAFRDLMDALPRRLRKLTVTLDDGCFDTLAHIAQRLPWLETLVLCNVILADFDAIATAAAPPSFPHLRAFEIQLYLDTDLKPDVSRRTDAFFDDWKKRAAPRLQNVRVVLGETAIVLCDSPVLLDSRQH